MFNNILIRNTICVSLHFGKRSNVITRFSSSTPVPGNVVVITGASAGLGKEAAYQLAAKNLHVILANRSKAKTDPIVEDIKQKTGNNSVEFMELDTSSIKSVQTFVEEYKKRNLPLHVLINNAGIAGYSAISEDGYELQFATNFLGHFVLTTGLLNVIEQSAPARIIHVSSDAYRAVTKDIDYQRIREIDKSFPVSIQSYAYSKFAQVVFSNMLAKRMHAKNIKVYSVALQPGSVATDIWRTRGKIWNWFVTKFSSPVSVGVKGIVHLALAPLETLQNGGFYNRLKLSPSTPQANNSEIQERLWRFGEQAMRN